MKKYIFLVGLVFLFIRAYGAPVDSIRISQLVEGFIYQNYFGSCDLRIKSIQPLILSNDTIALSVVNLNPSGWIIVSKDDAVQPVYGYNFDRDFDKRSLNNDPGMKFVFGVLDKQVKESLTNNTATSNPEWQLSKVQRRSATVAMDVQPLIGISWDQGIGWNRFCPEDASGPGGHVYVGCVAVAMAQAMSVYKYPSKGVGTKSYNDAKYGRQMVNFDAYGPYNWVNIMGGSGSSNDDIAALLYHCAVTVDMSFGADGSGAYVRSVASALKNYFSFSKSVAAVDRVASDAEWTALLNNELINGRPVVYGGDAGDGKPGHAFNIDGVASNGFYHLNWGWSGANNGYFSISNLKPGSFDFTKNQSAVIGIKPIKPGPIDISLSNSTILESLPVGSVVGNILVEDDLSGNTYNYTLSGTYNIFDELNPVYFLQENGVLKTTKIFDFVSGKANRESLVMTVKDKFGNSLSKTISVNILENATSLTTAELRSDNRAYYNRGNNCIEVSLSIQPKGIQIFTPSGTVVFKSEHETQLFDVSGLSSGVYIAVLKTSSGLIRFKFAKE